MIIQSKRVYFEEKMQPKQVEIIGDRIKGIYPYGCVEGAIDYGNKIIMPGLIDVHNHGWNGIHSSVATKQWLHDWEEYLPHEAVTSTLMTISSGNTEEGLVRALENYREYISEEHKGANILGVYEEGPFTGKMPGAQSEANRIIPTKEVIDEFNEACGGRLLYVMIAPEMLDGNYEVIDYCVSKGMKVAIGHSGATFDQCTEAIRHGAVSFTHTYNGMKGLHHREPGVVGAAMYYDDCYAELICDGVHVNKYSCNVLAKTKSKDKLIIVTDSTEAKGLIPGEYSFNGKTKIVCEDGVCRLPNGTISGSCHRLNRLLRYAIEEAQIGLVKAMNAVTVNPARMLGIMDRGIIAEGCYADIVVLDEEYEPVVVYINGEQYPL